MASRELMEARCGTCHKERRPKGTDWLDRGRALMADRNCVACHEVPGHDVAEVRSPRLDGLPLKVSPAWLRGWLKKPKSYLPKSRMGDFRLSERDVEALTAFLLQPRPSPPLDPVDWSKADAEKGGEVFRGARCVTCHEVNGRGGTLGPGAHPRRGQGLARVALLLDPRPAPLPAEDAHAALPLHGRAGPGPRGLPLLRVRRGARGLRGERRAAVRRRSREEGRSVFEKRGCYSCHELEGFPALARIGPKLAAIGDRVLEPAAARRARDPAHAAQLALHEGERAGARARAPPACRPSASRRTRRRR